MAILDWSCPQPNGIATLKCFEDVFRNILGVLVQAGGVVAFIFIIIGGFGYLTSGGDPKKTQAAQNTLTYAVVGLVLLIVAWIILSFLGEFTGLPNLLKFEIPT